jgi:hypothetical protein
MDDRALDTTPEAQAIGVRSCRWDTAARPWEEIWIEEPQGQGRLHPDPAAHKGQPAQGIKGGAIVTLWWLRFNGQCWRLVDLQLPAPISFPRGL